MTPCRPLPPVAVVAANSGWNIVNFRKPLVEALVDAGWRVVVLAAEDEYSSRIPSLGAEFRAVAVDSGGTSPLSDARLLFEYRRQLADLRPQALLTFTIKPNIYASLAARGLGILVVNNVSGLGSAFLRSGPLQWIVRRLYRLALRPSHRVFFQNPQDRDLFLQSGLATERQAGLVAGSGVDLRAYAPHPPPAGAPSRFLFIGRLLRDKGLVEYAQAARMVRRQFPEVRFAILGPAGVDNPSAVPITEVERWRDEGLVDYLGESDDVRPFIAGSDCIVLPSYREGLPRSLLEAAAMARPVIATDVAGCNMVVEHGRTGFLCEVRSARALADAMTAMLRLDASERAQMGLRGRSKVEREFDQALVVKAYLDVLK